ncbi:hypothetical protein V1280_006180 [Bradyrhizobium sp. AZCC 2230]
MRLYVWGMISAQTRSAFVARENRVTLFRIMAYGSATMLAQHVMALQTVLQRPNPL